MPTNEIPAAIVLGHTYTVPPRDSMTAAEIVAHFDTQRGPVFWWVDDDGSLTYAPRPLQRSRIVVTGGLAVEQLGLAQET